MDLYCGIDWATAHHDVAVVDADGGVVARGRVGNDAAGFGQLLTLLAEAGDSAEHPIHRRAFLRAARKVHTPKQNLVVEARRCEDPLEQVVQERTDSGHLLWEGENRHAPTRIALTLHAT